MTDNNPNGSNDRTLIVGDMLALAQIVDGQVIPGERYPCEKDLGSIGLPMTDDPGGEAEGEGEAEAEGDE